MKYNKESTYEYKGKNIVFKYSSDPSLSKMMNIVDDIANGVFNDITGYEPLLRDYFIDVSIINSLTTIELPEGFNDSSEFIKETHLSNLIQNLIPDICEKVISAADKKIDFNLKQYASRSKVDELFDALISLVNKYGEMFNETDISSMMDKLTSISELANIPKEEIVKNVLQFEKKEHENNEN